MDLNRKKQLLQEYKNRRPEMGVISLRRKTTGESFLGISRKTRADFNGIQCRLDGNTHPNKHLQALWNAYGMRDFEHALPASPSQRGYGNKRTATPVGSEFVENLSKDLRLEYPGTEGFFVRNLNYMKQFSLRIQQISESN